MTFHAMIELKCMRRTRTNDVMSVLLIIIVRTHAMCALAAGALVLLWQCGQAFHDIKDR